MTVGETGREVRTRLHFLPEAELSARVEAEKRAV